MERLGQVVEEADELLAWIKKSPLKGLITLPEKITDTGPKPGNTHQVKRMFRDTTTFSCD
ncbi:hypothetical protein P378_17640 [Desulforamulus profundi]|uniref:Uncharacterized protein n=1 Tax=Desulforamulus profundi TaxID=1383067 RepID=A0A2C6MD45_9FIRM|nr:hypothetical protein [Desulforamulus profundi]PHJ37243.1 hypothetical protein P378_17640 [Desulforamulus profundi]